MSRSAVWQIMSADLLRKRSHQRPTKRKRKLSSWPLPALHTNYTRTRIRRRHRCRVISCGDTLIARWLLVGIKQPEKKRRRLSTKLILAAFGLCIDHVALDGFRTELCMHLEKFVPRASWWPTYNPIWLMHFGSCRLYARNATLRTVYWPRSVRNDTNVHFNISVGF